MVVFAHLFFLTWQISSVSKVRNNLRKTSAASGLGGVGLAGPGARRA